MSATILRGDARNLPLPDESVDLLVTSPPYFGLRAYTDGGEQYEGQIGAEPTPREYVAALLECTREWVRVLKPSGSLWINLGDKYVGGGQGGNVGGNLDNPNNRVNATAARRIPPGTRPKSLLGLPWRYALGCIDDLGLILRAEVIWAKPNGLPESVTDRVRRSHEQWFWLTRQAPDTPAPPELVRAVLDQVANGTLTVDEAERILTADMQSHEDWFHLVKSPRYFSAVDEIRKQYAPDSLRASKQGARAMKARNASIDGGCTPYNRDGNPLGKLPGSVWEVATQPLKVPAELEVDHFAAFPLELPRRIITGWSPSGGVVLDPFGGTGTTALVADVLGRHGVSVDRSADYCRLAAWRTTDSGERARVLGKPKPPKPMDGQGDLFEVAS